MHKCVSVEDHPWKKTPITKSVKHDTQAVALVAAEGDSCSCAAVQDFACPFAEDSAIPSAVAVVAIALAALVVVQEGTSPGGWVRIYLHCYTLALG